MIIGKPITFGSGGLMAEISVGGDVTSTDTITCTNGLKSYSAIWVTDHFVISGLDLGTYTVTATRGSKVIPYTVLIDEIAQYEVEISYKLYLYNEGDECETLTGGWGSKTSSGTTTKNATSMEGYSANVRNSYGLLVTTNQINFSGYSTLNLIVDSITTVGALFLNTSSQTSMDISLQSYMVVGTVSIPLATYQSQYYVSFGGEVGAGAVRRGCKVSKIWLE